MFDVESPIVSILLEGRPVLRISQLDFIRGDRLEVSNTDAILQCAMALDADDTVLIFFYMSG